MFAYGETVIVITEAVDADPYSGDAATAGSTFDVPGCAVEPRPSNEPTQDARNSTISGYTLYMPVSVEIGPQNRVYVRGGTFDVLGEPAFWRNPFTGWEPGIVVQCGRTAG